VHSDGRLAIEKREEHFQHPSQWTCFDGKGAYVDDKRYVPDMEAPREQGRGKRWCWVPWTGEMEGICGETGLKVKLRGWNSAIVEQEGEDGMNKEGAEGGGNDVRRSKRVRRK
jgi:hypothetical protein